MYKVFFKDRTVFFTDDFHECIRRNTGLIYKYESTRALHALVDIFYDLEEVKDFFLYHIDLDYLWKEFSSTFRTIEAGGGLVKNDKEQFLFIKRRGNWDLPKGKVDEGETMEETALREVKEECGITELTNGRMIAETYHTYKIGNEKILKKTVWFEMRYHGDNSASPQEEEDITEIKWLKPSELDLIFDNTYASIIDVLNSAGLKH